MASPRPINRPPACRISDSERWPSTIATIATGKKKNKIPQIRLPIAFPLISDGPTYRGVGPSKAGAGGAKGRCPCSSAPHLEQKRPSFGFSAPHSAQNTASPPAAYSEGIYLLRYPFGSRLSMYPLFPLRKATSGATMLAFMAAHDTSIVVLAAGKGTRMRSDLAKVLHRAGGRPILETVVRACQPLKAAQILVVVGHQAEDVAAVAEQLGAQTVVQQPQRGTGHAMQVARRAIRKSAKLAIVLVGDAVLLRTETLAALLDTHRRSEAAATILTAELADPGSYGRVLRDAEGRVQAIVEDGSLTTEQRAIREVNSAIYCFTLEKLWPCLAALRPENSQRELYLTDAIAMLRARNERVIAQIASDADEVLGCNTRADLAAADRVLRARKAAELMASGVTIYLPETVVIDPDVVV